MNVNFDQFQESVSPEEVIAECQRLLSVTADTDIARMSTAEAYRLAITRRLLKQRMADANADAAVRDALLKPTATPLARTRDAVATAAMMPAGLYWVGDLCYVLGTAWDSVWRLPDGVHTLHDGRCIAMFSTVHGDGTYRDEQFREYSVDSGSLGCILAAEVRRADVFSGRAAGELGEFVTAAEPFTPRRSYPPGSWSQADGGVLELAGVRIHLDHGDADE